MTRLPILTYHRILPGEATKAADPNRIAVSAAQFRSHLKWLKRLGFRSFPLKDYPAALREKKPIPARSVGITFDDGYIEVLTLGLPILQEFGFTATVFAVSGEFGGTNRWDSGTERLMSAQEYRSWIAGGMTVGSHTRTHAHLTQRSPDQVRDELAGSKNDLETALGCAIPTLAYPYGESNAVVNQIAQESGYTCAFATDQAPIDHASNLYRLRRAVVFPKNTTPQILLKAQPWYSRYQAFKRGER